MLSEIKPHKYFEREMASMFGLHSMFHLLMQHLVLSFRCITLDGAVKYNMPAGTQPGRVFKLKIKVLTD